MKLYDVVILTQKKFFNPKNPDWYAKQAIKEDEDIQKALETKGLKVIKTYWDNPNFDFTEAKITLFRTIWDYFHRFNEFSEWLNKTKHKTHFINPPEIIYWNIDKHYLQNLSEKGINIPNTYFIDKGDERTLTEIFNYCNWKDAVLKPTVSGAGRYTYKLSSENLNSYEQIFSKLIKEEDFMLQEFQYNIYEKGELAFIIFNGKFSHAVLKKGKKGEFKVQDDFGGTVHNYTPTKEEIIFAEKVVSVCNPSPTYARIDIIFDNNNKPAIGELELIEPELWFRYNSASANLFADAILEKLKTVS